MRRLLLVLALAPVAGGAHAQDTRVGGGLYLFQYRPLDLPGAQPRTEVYAAFLTAQARRGRWSAHAELRARDTKLRDFFPGTTWIQEAWAEFDPHLDSSRGTLALRAGKFYQVLGRFWDASFFGNIQYFDGLKLNPQFGVEATGSRDLGHVRLGYTLQYLLESDRISGALPGRDFETMPGFRNRDGVASRLSFSAGRGFTVAGTFAWRGVAHEAGTREQVYHVPHAGLDVEFVRGPVTVYGEWLRRTDGTLPTALTGTQPGSAATYWLAGLQLNRGPIHLRYNFSRVHYDALDRAEWIHQPGITYDLAANVRVLTELDFWQFRDPAGSGRLDRSLDVVLRLAF